MFFFLLLNILQATAWSATVPPALDNGVAGLPEVDCMEDRVKLTFKTQRPFQGRIFVKGMVDKDPCETNFVANQNPTVQFELQNGACNMRRQRMIGPDQRGIEQSITIIISFHSTFITKIDRAYRCTCFYMEADKVVTSGLTVSQLPTTDLIDTARMPLCTYSVRKDSVNGPLVTYARVGDPVYHVWQCESEMFSMLVHSCFVDDGNGQDQKPLIDEHGCAIDPIIVPDLVYNKENNLAYAEVNVFKFADKVSTYFQCAVSTCMNSEGMCDGKTPPRCGPVRRLAREAPSTPMNKNRTNWVHLDNTMDLSAQRITVLELEENQEDPAQSFNTRSPAYLEPPAEPYIPISHRAAALVCIAPQTASLLTAISIFSLAATVVLTIIVLKRKQTKLVL